MGRTVTNMLEGLSPGFPILETAIASQNGSLGCGPTDVAQMQLGRQVCLRLHNRGSQCTAGAHGLQKLTLRSASLSCAASVFLCFAVPFVSSFFPFFLLSFFLPSCLSFFPSFLPSFLPSCLSFLPSFLPWLVACLVASTLLARSLARSLAWRRRWPSIPRSAWCGAACCAMCSTCRGLGSRASGLGPEEVGGGRRRSEEVVAGGRLGRCRRRGGKVFGFFCGFARLSRFQVGLWNPERLCGYLVQIPGLLGGAHLSLHCFQVGLQWRKGSRDFEGLCTHTQRGRAQKRAQNPCQSVDDQLTRATIKAEG